MHYHLLEHQGGVETQTWKRGLWLPLRGLADDSVSENHYCIFSFEHLQQRFRNKTFFQIKDLRHPDDTSIRVTADDVNFVTNPEYLYCT